MHWTDEYFHLNVFSVRASSTVLQDFRPKAAPQLPMLTKFSNNGASQIQTSAQLLLYPSFLCRILNQLPIILPSRLAHTHSSLPLVFLYQKDKRAFYKPSEQEIVPTIINSQPLTKIHVFLFSSYSASPPPHFLFFFFSLMGVQRRN
jgi:hypothetical protein